MKKILFVSFLFLLSCKKETVEIEHEVQFQSNIITVNGTYDLTIDGIASDINSVYKVKSETEVNLLLIRDTNNVWLTGTIYVDGKAVSYYAGYKDTTYVDGVIDIYAEGYKDTINLIYKIK